MRLSQILFLSIICFAVLIPVVSASPASTTAQQVNTLLDKKTPYTIELTESQMNSSGFSASNLRNRGTYKIIIKSVKYDPNKETLVFNINAWRNGKSVKVNNPVHFYMPWSGGVSGVTANVQLQNYGWVLVNFVDGLPLGEPVNDDTLLIYPDISGYARQTTDGSWATLRGGAGEASGYASTSISYPVLDSTTTLDVYGQMGRAILSYNTSGIPDDATVDSAKFSTVAYGWANGLGSAAFGITGGTLASNTSIVNGDYDGFGSTRYATDIPYASLIAGRNNWTLNSDGLSALSKTKYTIFYLRDSWDINNSFTGTWASATTTAYNFRGVLYAVEGDRPYLQIVYTPGAGGDTTPPASITNLTNTTGCSWIKWDWTNPADSDFNHTYVLKDNVFYTNVSNATATLNWTGLSELTAYTFSSKTVDITGNINATWVNLSSTTTSCPVVTPTPTATPTPIPTPVPLGCSYINATGMVVVGNYTNLTSTIGNISWGTTVWNVTQGNVSWWTCLIATPTPTPTPIISRLIVNPSIESQPFFCRFSLTRWTPLCPKE